MKRELRSRFGVEKLLLIGALIALVFSNAEGISLLPFPDSSSQSAGTVAGNGSHDTYSQTINPGRLLQAKYAKQKLADPFAGNAFAPSTGPIEVSYDSSRAAIGRVLITVASPFLTSRVTRGPPSI